MSSSLKRVFICIDKSEPLFAFHINSYITDFHRKQIFLLIIASTESKSFFIPQHQRKANLFLIIALTESRYFDLSRYFENFWIQSTNVFLQKGVCNILDMEQSFIGLLVFSHFHYTKQSGFIFFYQLNIEFSKVTILCGSEEISQCTIVYIIVLGGKS